MKKFAFVSRHFPTEGQRALAKESGVKLIHVGDIDAFSFPAEMFRGEYDGVVVVHPQAALTAYAAGIPVGVFNNVNRAPIGEPPRFETTSFVVSTP